MEKKVPKWNPEEPENSKIEIQTKKLIKTQKLIK